MVARLKVKIKSNVSASKGYIYIKDVFSSYGTTETAKTNKTITVNITSESIPTSTGTSNNNKGPSTNNKNTGTQGQVQSKSETTAKNSSLPKAGLSPWLGIGIIIAMIGAVIVYIQYKKIN